MTKSEAEQILVEYLSQQFLPYDVKRAFDVLRRPAVVEVLPAISTATLMLGTETQTEWGV